MYCCTLLIILSPWTQAAAEEPRKLSFLERMSTIEFGENLLAVPRHSADRVLTLKQWKDYFPRDSGWPSFREMFRKELGLRAKDDDLLWVYVPKDPQAPDVVEWRATVNRVPLRFLHFTNGMRTIVPLPNDIKKRRAFAERFISELVILEDPEHKPPFKLGIPWPAELTDGTKFGTSNGPVTRTEFWFQRIDIVIEDGSLHMLTYRGNPMTLQPRDIKWLPKHILKPLPEAPKPVPKPKIPEPKLPET